MLIVRFWMKIPKIVSTKSDEDTKTLESYRFINLQDKSDPQIKEMVEDWASDFPQWYNKVAYLKFGYDIIEEIDDATRTLIEKEIDLTKEKIINMNKRLMDLVLLVRSQTEKAGDFESPNLGSNPGGPAT